MGIYLQRDKEEQDMRREYEIISVRGREISRKIHAENLQ